MRDNLSQQLRALKEDQKSQLNPDSVWVARQRQTLLARIEHDHDGVVQKKQQSRADFSASLARATSIFFPKTVSWARPILTAILLVVIGMGGMQATANAAPGNLFYKVKLAKEKAQIAMVSVVVDDETMAKLRADLALRRSKEMKEIVADSSQTEKKQAKIIQGKKEAIKNLQENLQKSNETMRKVTAANPERGASLLKETVKRSSEIVDNLDAVVQTNDEQNKELNKEVAATKQTVTKQSLELVGQVLDQKGDDEQVNEIAVKVIEDVIEGASQVKDKVNIIPVGDGQSVSSTPGAIPGKNSSSTPNGQVEPAGGVQPNNQISEAGVAKEKVAQINKSIEELNGLIAENNPGKLAEAINKAKEVNAVANETNNLLNEINNNVKQESVGGKVDGLQVEQPGASVESSTVVQGANLGAGAVK